MCHAELVLISDSFSLLDTLEDFIIVIVTTQFNYQRTFLSQWVARIQILSFNGKTFASYLVLQQFH